MPGWIRECRWNNGKKGRAFFLVFSSGYSVFSVALWEHMSEHERHLEKARGVLPKFIYYDMDSPWHRGPEVPGHACHGFCVAREPERILYLKRRSAHGPGQAKGDGTHVAG